MRAHASPPPPPGRGRSVGTPWGKVHLPLASMLRRIILNTPVSVTDESTHLFDNLFYQLLVILNLTPAHCTCTGTACLQSALITLLMSHERQNSFQAFSLFPIIKSKIWPLCTASAEAPNRGGRGRLREGAGG